MTGKVVSVQRNRNIDFDTGVDECIITIGFDEIYAYYRYNDLLGYVDKDVDYLTRLDIVNGKPVQVLCEIGEVSHIQTIDAVKAVRLYTEDNKRPYCNFSLRTLRMGEFYPRSVAYMSGYTEGASKRAHWFDCDCLDRDSKVFILRVFAAADDEEVDYRDRLAGMIGSYIEFDLQLTRFGYQTQRITKLDWHGGEVSPEVYLAQKILEEELTKDPPLMEFVRKFDLINALAGKMDGEPGYQLVRMASEIYFINAMENVTGDIDVRAMRRAVYCSRFYMLATTSTYSRSVFNVNRVLRSADLKLDKELLHILDVLSGDTPSATKILYVRIRQIVDTVIQIRRGEEYEKDFISNSINVVSQFGGLL